MQNESGENGLKARQCSHCKRPCRGHEGPLGAKCPHSPLPETQEVDATQDVPAEAGRTAGEAQSSRGAVTGSGEPASLSHVGGHDGNAVVLQQLVEQMSCLNEGLLAMQSSQAKLLDLLAEKASGVQGATAEPGKIGATLEGNPAFIPSDGTPRKSVSAAVSGEFVELSDFLPCSEAVGQACDASVDNHGIIKLRTGKNKQGITNFLSWLRAWNQFEHIVLQSKADLYDKLATYRRLIQECDRKYKWQDVYMYDVKFRSKLASSSDKFAYDRVDVEIFVTTLDATAVKQSGFSCFRCKSSEHKVQNCPFQASEAMQEKPKSQVWFHQGREICNNWQVGKCTYTGCRRAHVCRKCRGPEPYFQCGTCSRGTFTGAPQPGGWNPY